MEGQGTDTPEGVENKVGDSDASTNDTPVIPEGQSDATDTGAEIGGESDTPEAGSELSGNEGETTGDSDTSDGEGLKGKGAKKRIDKLTKDNYQLRERLNELESRKQESAALPELGPEPKEEDFENYDEYLKAHTKWTVKSELHENKEAERLESAKKSSERQAQDRRKAFGKRAYEFMETTPDFQKVAMSPEMIDLYSNYAKHLGEAIESSEKGPEIAYYLGNNPDIAIKLADMLPTQAAIEIGKLEVKLSEQPAPRAVSKAPDPITPVGGNQGITEKAPTEMTDAEFAAWRKKHIANRVNR